MLKTTVNDRQPPEIDKRDNFALHGTFFCQQKDAVADCKCIVWGHSSYEVEWGPELTVECYTSYCVTARVYNWNLCNKRFTKGDSIWMALSLLQVSVYQLLF